MNSILTYVSLRNGCVDGIISRAVLFICKLYCIQISKMVFLYMCRDVTLKLLHQTWNESVRIILQSFKQDIGVFFENHTVVEDLRVVGTDVHARDRLEISANSSDEKLRSVCYEGLHWLL